MKNRKPTLWAIAAMLGFSLTALGAQKFSGDIMDSQCAIAGSHAKMEAMHHMPASSKLTGKAARMCTLQCVKMGAHFVLYNPSTKKIYKLNPDRDAKAHAGERVSVTGTLSGDTIQVQKISKRHL